MAGRTKTVNALYLAAGRKDQVTITVDASVLVDALTALAYTHRNADRDEHYWISEAGWQESLNRLQTAITKAVG